MSDVDAVRFMTKDDVAEVLCINARSVYRLVAAGEIPPPLKVGRLSRWPESEIRAYVETLVKRRDRRSNGVGRTQF